MLKFNPFDTSLIQIWGLGLNTFVILCFIFYNQYLDNIKEDNPQKV